MVKKENINSINVEHIVIHGDNDINTINGNRFINKLKGTYPIRLIYELIVKLNN